MEAEAQRLFKTLYDLNTEEKVDSGKGMAMRELLDAAGSEFSTDSNGKPAMLVLLFYLIRAAKDHFTFSIRTTTARKRRSEDVVSPAEGFADLQRRMLKVKDPVERAISISPAIPAGIGRTNKLMELLYNRAKNFDTYAIYKFIAEAGPDGITYAQISQKYNKEYGPEKHLSSLKIANYCKKMLEKNGFIQCVQGSSNDTNSGAKGTEKVAVLTKHAYKTLRKELFSLEPGATVRPGKRALPADEEPKMPKTKEKIVEHRQELESIRQQSRGMTMRQIIGVGIRSRLAQEQGGLTIGEIAYTLDMEKAKKAVNRVLEDMTRSNPAIYGSTEGSGKVRFNKYVLAGVGPAAGIQPSQQRLKEEEEDGEAGNVLTGYYAKFEHLARVLEEGPRNNPILEGLNSLLDLNENSVKLMEAQLEERIPGFRHKFRNSLRNNSDHFKKLVVKTVLVGIIEESDRAAQKQKKRREITNEALNRYIFCLNKVEENKVLSMLELLNMILNDLEKSHGITIARKTLKKITSNLTHSGLIRTSAFTVNLCPSESEEATASFTRYIFYSPEVVPTDPRIVTKSQVDNKAPRKESLALPSSPPAAVPTEEAAPEVDLEKCKVPAKEVAQKLVQAAIKRKMLKSLRSAFGRFRDRVQRGILRDKMLSMFAAPIADSLQGESCLGELDLWKSLPMPDAAGAAEAGHDNDEDTKDSGDLIHRVDGRIRAKERQSRASFSDNLKVATDQLQYLRSRFPEISLTALLKKCKITRQGATMLGLLQRNGVVELKRQPQVGVRRVFGEEKLAVPDVLDYVRDETEEHRAKQEFALSSVEYMTELKREEILIIPSGR